MTAPEPGLLTADISEMPSSRFFFFLSVHSNAAFCNSWQLFNLAKKSLLPLRALVYHWGSCSGFAQSCLSIVSRVGGICLLRQWQRWFGKGNFCCSNLLRSFANSKTKTVKRILLWRFWLRWKSFLPFKYYFHWESRSLLRVYLCGCVRCSCMWRWYMS